MLYSERENSMETLRFLAINNKENLAQIFTDIRYKKEDNEFFSAKFLKVIKEQGFME
jgi:hypothetical protein